MTKRKPKLIVAVYVQYQGEHLVNVTPEYKEFIEYLKNNKSEIDRAYQNGYKDGKNFVKYNLIKAFQEEQP